MGQGIHYNYCQMRGLDGWPRNSRAHDSAPDLTYLIYYTCCSNELVFVSNIFFQVIHSNFCQMHDLDKWPRNPWSRPFALDLGYLNCSSIYSSWNIWDHWQNNMTSKSCLAISLLRNAYMYVALDNLVQESGSTSHWAQSKGPIPEAACLISVYDFTGDLYPRSEVKR